MSGAATPTATEPPQLDDRDMEPRTPMKRLGSTRKLAAFNNIRLQLAEQTRVLEARAEATAGVAGELHDYCRRRADLEHEYSRALDKLAKAAAARDRDQRHRREHWPLAGAHACWQAALDDARALARDHAALAELYAGPLAARLQRAADDALRLHRKWRDALAERHEELGAALAAAAAAAKDHAAAAADWRAAALKLRHAHDQRRRLAAASPPRPKKLKALDKELDKRRARHADARARGLRARADYALSLEAANASLQRYYLDDVADVILCMEVGFEAAVCRAVRCAADAEGACAAAGGEAASALRHAADALDALADRQRLLQAHAQTFALPRPVAFQGAAPDAQDAEMRALAADAAPDADEAAERAAQDLAQRLHTLAAAARLLRAECRENAKTLDAAEAELIKQVEGADADWEVAHLFGAGGAGAAGVRPAPPPPPEDQEDYYLAKFRAYVSSAGRLARLESKAAAVRGRLLGAGAGAGASAGAGAESPPTPPRRAAARLRRGQFAAPLEQGLPRVLTSCVRVIALHGLRQQGVFRVSGSQVETQALRAAYERGEDPLARASAADVNSVCGLLKLYLRELRPPLLPPQLQARLLRVASLREDAAFAAGMRATLAALPAPALLVLRYLFAFLAHVAEHAPANMMDAWNLAICLGPTLLAAWGDAAGAQVAQQNLLNELVKRTIELHEDIFPRDLAPHALYRRPGEEEAAAETELLRAEAEAPADEAPDADAELAPPSADEPDAPDDLSLYGDDDDISDEDAASGEWPHADGQADDDEPCRSAAAPQEASGAAPAAGARGLAPAPAPAPARAHPAPAPPPPRRLAESTPDLVLDLPARAPTPSGPAGPAPGASDPVSAPAADAAPPAPEPQPLADSADTFLHNRDTLKKRPPRRLSRSDGAGEEEAAASGSGSGSGSGPNSPVPARNTARVCAQFADLTLTGGSLKPALAAKPALLRRPTPHPHHPRP